MTLRMRGMVDRTRHVRTGRAVSAHVLACRRGAGAGIVACALAAAALVAAPRTAGGAPQAVAVQAPAATVPAVAIRRDVERLAAPALDGRRTGTPGADNAAALIIEELVAAGVKPLPGQKDLRVPFEFTAGVTDGGTSLSISAGQASARRFQGAPAVQALSFSDTREVSGDVVFAGYGLVVPDGQGTSYDSYVGLNVKDKVVVVLRYFPEDVDQQMRATLARYSGLRFKAMAARERGAKAVIIVTGPRSPGAGALVPMSFDTALAGSGIVAATIGTEALGPLWAGRQKSLEEVQKELDTGNPHVAGFALDGVTVTLDAKISRETRPTFNVVGHLPSTGDQPTGRGYVLAGAHYDHLGHGDQGSSLARQDEAGGIHHGADDNASGVSAILAIARSLASRPRKRAIVFALWSGEEMGLLGSHAFATGSLLPVDRLAAYVNFDMVGRMVNNKLTVQAVGSSAAWPRLLEQVNVREGFDLALQNDPYLPTDSASFNLAGVPTLNFFTGSHQDYHRPSDTADKINYEDLERVANFGASVILRLANAEEAPSFTKVQQTMESGGSRDAVRVFTGTIPDYATEVNGLLLSGVIAGGPAEQAGLQGGDILIEFAGQKIANIYDYTYALDAVKVDQPVKVVYMRKGERRETTLTPRARR